MTRLDEDIRLHRDGSIDYAYYLQRGRVMRSEQAHRLFRKATVPAPRWSLRDLWAVFPRFVS
ncbi:hypothetical protein [Thalassovita aquimarina]|uniref:hypothetical protein n=1 Tax=Thalassovita aquimarina TaxID=2785917 RepID=UPI00356A583B